MNISREGAGYVGVGHAAVDVSGNALRTTDEGLFAGGGGGVQC